MIDLSKEISQKLRDYTGEVEEALEDVKKELADIARDEAKRLAPVDKGNYKKSISIKKTKYGFIVFAKQYQLTHLLEKGHQNRNGGRTKAYPHWQPAEDLIFKKADEKFKEKLK